MHPTFKGRAAPWAALTFALGLSGCFEGPGSGVQPDDLRVLYSDGTGSGTMYECQASTATAQVHFSSGEETDDSSWSDFTSRVTWSSTNPDVVAVSSSGALTAEKTGTADIVATYLDFSASMTVEVKAMQSLRITSADTASNDDTAITDVGVDTYQNLALKIVYDDTLPETDVTSSATWTMDKGSDYAYVDSGVVTGVTDSGDDKVTVKAELTDCNQEATTSFRISKVQALNLTYLNGGDTRMPYYTVDRVQAWGTFDKTDSEPQNLSEQVDFDNSDSDTDVLTTDQESDGIYVSMSTKDTGSLELRMLDLDLKATTIEWSGYDDDLLQLTFSPTDFTLTYPAYSYVTATGVFEDGLVRDLTRDVTWDFGDSTAATISTSGVDAGKVQSEDVDVDTQMWAVWTGDTGMDPVYGELHIYSADSD